MDASILALLVLLIVVGGVIVYASGGSLLGWAFAILLIILVAALLIGAYNRIIRFSNNIDNAWAQIDVQLKRRADLIPNLVETVKGYAGHEKTVLEDVTNARASLMNAGSRQDAMDANNMLGAALGRLFAVAEAYPNLKANENFLSLQDELSHTENKVAFARQHYNDTVLEYNNAVSTFPGNMYAGMMGKTKHAMLEIPPEAREVPKVSFGAAAPGPSAGPGSGTAPATGGSPPPAGGMGTPNRP
ncbi:MAG: LemA family protein [Thermoplasmatota archaeon]